jgi:hypothetical protein
MRVIDPEKKSSEDLVTDTPATSELSFDRDIRPLFREKDRSAMLEQFDLWKHADVKGNQEAILDRVRKGQMPCDGAWPPADVIAFSSWIAGGSQP